VASQLIEEVTAHAQSASLEDAREICADGSYFPNNVRIYFQFSSAYVAKVVVFWGIYTALYTGFVLPHFPLSIALLNQNT